VSAVPCRSWVHSLSLHDALPISWMDEVLAESDQLIEEVRAADALVLGVPLYNFSVPSAFKAWIDNIIRVGRTVIVNPDSLDDPRSEEHTSELQSRENLVCRLLLE